jgi:hypothetical protein
MNERERRRAEYIAYLASEDWRKLRGAALDWSRGKCDFCGELAEQVHHVRYPKTFGDERPSDVVSVCRRCHELSHGRQPMQELTNAETYRVIAACGKAFPHLVSDEGKVWSTFDHWCTSLQIPSFLRKRFEIQLETAARDEEHAGNVCQARYQDKTVFRWHAAMRAMEQFEHAYHAEQFRDLKSRRWTDDERDAMEVVHKHYRALVRWGQDLQEQAFAAKLTQAREAAKSQAVSPQMLLDAIKHAVAPRLHAHDQKIAEHDIVIGAIKEAAPFLQDQDEFITLRQGAVELGKDPTMMPNFPRTKETLSGLAGRLLKERGARTGTPVAARLEGSSVTAEMNTYRRADVYATLRELTKGDDQQSLLN